MREREIGIARSQEGGRDEIISAIVVVVVCVIVGRHGSFPINHVEHLPSVENGEHHDASDHIMEHRNPQTGKQRLLVAHPNTCFTNFLSCSVLSHAHFSTLCFSLVLCLGPCQRTIMMLRWMHYARLLITHDRVVC